MRLLRFTVSNHRSIHTEHTLDLAPALGNRSTPPPGKSWDDVAVSSAAILGPNASGKSNLLDALRYVRAAISLSATRWQDRSENPSVPHYPYTLIAREDRGPSRYELDVEHEGTRYHYGFLVDSSGFTDEWLSRVPNRRWSPCFSRTREDGKTDIEWNSAFISKSARAGLGNVAPRELVLSAALRSEVSPLAELAEAVLGYFDTIDYGDVETDHRIYRLVRSIKKGDFQLDELSRLLKVADLGITKITVDEKKIPSDVLAKWSRIQEILEGRDDPRGAAEGNGSTRPTEDAGLTEDEAEDLAYNLVFHHQGSEGESFALSLKDESDGTRTWLSVAPAIITTLRRGGVLLADEIDTSLHQNMVELIIKTFTDPNINVRGAQLIFTSHNTNILEHMGELGLTEKHIWFTEKNGLGESSYFSLSDYPKSKDANHERRYLAGRYGAIPMLAPSVLRGIVGPDEDGQNE